MDNFGPCAWSRIEVTMHRSSTEKVMQLDSSLKTVSAFTAPEQFESIRQHIDPAWVAEALEATGTATVRSDGCRRTRWCGS